MVDERQHLIALERISGYMHDLEPSEYNAYQPPELVGTGVGARALAATLAWECLVEGRNRQRAIDLATFAVEDGALQQVDTGSAVGGGRQHARPQRCRHHAVLDRRAERCLLARRLVRRTRDPPLARLLPVAVR